MKLKIKSTFIILAFLAALPLAGQVDEDPPSSPVFTFVTINQTTGVTEMRWALSPPVEPDIAGFVVYRFENGEGYVLDTIFNPAATTYSYPSLITNIRSESYVVAAIDYSGNISPLSNELHTIYSEIIADTCNNRIHISWNKYSSFPVQVTGYEIRLSLNNGPYQVAGSVSAESQDFIYEGIENGSEYCYRVNAILENGLVSGSNIQCTTVNIKTPPQWINADFATVTEDGVIELSFTFDPDSETDLFALERKAGFSGSFEQIAQIRSSNSTISYFDTDSEPDVVYFYRLYAMNSCGIKAVASNIASNIYLDLQNTGNEIILKWNRYRDWKGNVESYRLFTDKGTGFIETELIEPTDTVFFISISDIMYSLEQNKICFYITGSESGNPYGITGETKSNHVCSEIEEIVTVPNVFTPGDDLINDNFGPVLTFTPSEYRMIISDRQGKVLFETDDYLEEWDGSFRGKIVPEGVYLWYLRIKTSEGRSISKTGTVTVVKK